MACLSCHCMTKTLTFACLSTSKDPSPSSLPQHTNTSDPKPLIPITKTKTRPPALPRKKRLPSKLQQKINLIRIERAVGAGSYRDLDPNNKSSFLDEKQIDCYLRGEVPIDANEGKVEKQLRETGKWITDKTETKIRSSGKSILMFIVKWVLPLYILMFLVTTKTVNLPFSIPALDDMLM